MSGIDYVRREDEFAAVEAMARRFRDPWQRRRPVGRRPADPADLVGAGNHRRNHPADHRRGVAVASQSPLMSLDDSQPSAHNKAQAESPRECGKGGMKE